MDTKEFLDAVIPPEVTRQDTVHRLKYAADSAERIMRRYADRKKDKEAQYYAGMRDAYLLAIKTLELE